MRLLASIPTFPAGSLDIRSQALKVLEEASELCEAVKSYDRHVSAGIENRDSGEFDKAASDVSDALEEFADVLQAMSNLAKVLNLSDESIEHAIEACTVRNEMRGRYRQ